MPSSPAVRLVGPFAAAIVLSAACAGPTVPALTPLPTPAVKGSPAAASPSPATSPSPAASPAAAPSPAVAPSPSPAAAPPPAAAPSPAAAAAPPAGAAPTAGDADAGLQLFTAKGCIACHVAPGVPAAFGTIGPDLTGFAGRPEIAGMVPNTPENLAQWLKDPPAVKPGTQMPSLNLSDQEVANLVAFLETLR